MAQTIQPESLKVEQELFYKADFKDIEAICIRISKLMDVLVNPNNSKFDNRKIGQNHIEFMPAFLAYSLDNVYKNMFLLATESQHISTGILARSILECLANISWLFESKDNKDELGRKTKILFDQANSVYDLTAGKVNSVQPIPKIGAGTLKSRLEKRGDGWLIIYSHLSSYSHMDAGFAVHYYLGETLGARNLFCLFSSWATLDSAKMLTELLPLVKGVRKKIEAEIKEVNTMIDELKRSLNRRSQEARSNNRAV